MRTALFQPAAGVLVIAAFAMSACTSDTPSQDSDAINSDSQASVQVTAAQDALFVSDKPLGDTGFGEMKAGETAEATCFVSDAMTNTGAHGSAVKINFDGRPGYVAVEIVDDASRDTVRFLEQSASALRKQLPGCSEG